MKPLPYPRAISDIINFMTNSYNQTIMETSKYEQALSQYNLNISDAEVAAAVKRIIEEKVPENDTIEVKTTRRVCWP